MIDGQSIKAWFDENIPDVVSRFEIRYHPLPLSVRVA